MPLAMWRLRPLRASIIGFGVLAVVMTSSCGSSDTGSDRAFPAAQQEPQSGPSVVEALPCTSEDEPTNFAAYSLGRDFEGLPLKSQLRRCTLPPPRAPPQVRQNSVIYIYGTCEVPEIPEGSCVPPVQVHSKPRCEVGFSPPSHHNPLADRILVRGVPARIYEDGYRLEMLVGRSTVTIHGVDRAQVLRAGRGLVRAPAIPSHPAREGDPTGPLPSPPSGLPASGPSPCG